MSILESELFNKLTMTLMIVAGTGFGANSFLVPMNGGNLGFSSTLISGGGTLPGGTPFIAKKSAISTQFAVNNIELNARAHEIESGWTFEDMGAGTFKFYKDNVVTDTFTKDANGDVAIKVGMYVPGDGGKLSRIKKIIKSTVNSGITTVYTFETHRAVTNNPIYAFKRFEDRCRCLQDVPIKRSFTRRKENCRFINIYQTRYWFR